MATRQNFEAKNYDPAGLERLKLEDGICIHENTKIELEVYAREKVNVAEVVAKLSNFATNFPLIFHA